MIYLHVGLHKTGSTFLQNEVFPGLINYNLITRPHTQYLRFFNELQYADRQTFYSKYTPEMIKTYINGDVIISDEALLGKPVGLSSNMRYEIINRLHYIFPDATILLSIRNQWDMMKSHYGQYLKQPFGVRLPEDFFANVDEGEDLEMLKNASLESARLKYDMNNYRYVLDQLDYSALLGALTDKFNNVEVLLFEDLRNDPTYVEHKLSNLFRQTVSIRNLPTVNIANSKHKNWARRCSNILTSGLGRGYTRELSYLFFLTLNLMMRKELVCRPECIVTPATQKFFEQSNTHLKERLPRLSLYHKEYRI